MDKLKVILDKGYVVEFQQHINKNGYFITLNSTVCSECKFTEDKEFLAESIEKVIDLAYEYTL
jgi:hypothetical protein